MRGDGQDCFNGAIPPFDQYRLFSRALIEIPWRGKGGLACMCIKQLPAKTGAKRYAGKSMGGGGRGEGRVPWMVLPFSCNSSLKREQRSARYSFYPKGREGGGGGEGSQLSNEETLNEIFTLI